jgi:hypothetical protein
MLSFNPQLIFDNFIHLASALLIGVAGYYILSRKAQAMGAPHQAPDLAPVPSRLSTGIAAEGAATGEVQAR